MTGQELSVVHQVRKALDKMQPDLRAALPAHIAPDHFIRLGQTAVQTGFELDQCTPKSIVGALVKCAEAGLLPDAEEAAIVSYNVKIKGRNGNPDRWEKQAKLMPMIRGLRKQVQQSGQVKDWYARIVYSKDYFKFICGDEEKLEHEPAFEEGDHPVRVYSIAKLENGEISRHVMRMDQIEKIRRRSRNAESGPWISDYEEMAKKTCMRQHFKSLPRAKDDLVRERMMRSIQAFDEAVDVIDTVHTPVLADRAGAAPALSLHRAASDRLAEAVEQTAFDSQTGEIQSTTIPVTPDEPPSAPTTTKPKGKRKTVSERLAEADGKALPAGNGAAPGAKSAGAPSGNAGARPAETRPNEHLERDFAQHQAEQAEIHAAAGQPEEDDFPGDRPSSIDQPAVDSMAEDEGDPQIEAFSAGWVARGQMKVKTAFPREIVGNKELMAFFGQGWDRFDSYAQKGTAPTTAHDSEELLNREIDRIFN